MLPEVFNSRILVMEVFNDIDWLYIPCMVLLILEVGDFYYQKKSAIRTTHVYKFAVSSSIPAASVIVVVLAR